MFTRWQLAASLCLAFIILPLLFGRHLGQLRVSVYPLVRGLAQLTTEWQTRGWQQAESAHFRLKYQSEDADVVRMVLAAAEATFEPATRRLDYRPSGRTLLLIYPDRESLARQFGWAADASAMGVYWAGVIRVLSPHDWIDASGQKEMAAVFGREGPVGHEFAHLLVDNLTRGNCPRWLTEGVAQVMERDLTGFVLPGPAAGGQRYTPEELDATFDSLPDQNLAYRQSLRMVEGILDRGGWTGLRRLLARLGEGVPQETAFSEMVHTTPLELALQARL